MTPETVEDRPTAVAFQPERAVRHAFFSQSNDAAFVICEQMTVHCANATLLQWLGLDGDLPSVTDLGLPEHEVGLARRVSAALQDEPSLIECCITPPGAASRQVEMRFTRLTDSAHPQVLVILRDLSLVHKLLEQLHYQARHDGLTGLLNRQAFLTQLENQLNETRNGDVEHTLLHLGLDQFRVVNDTCGHLAGDQLLQEVTRHLREQTRPQDSLARLGGDEFGIILDSCNHAAAVQIARRIRQSLSQQRFVWHNQRFEISIRIGGCPIRQDSESATAILSQADVACHDARHQPQHIQIQEQAFSSLTQQEMAWVARLTRALDDNLFRLYFQEIVPISDSKDHRAHREILLRLEEQPGRITPPSHFLAAAEKYNLMPAIDRWVIRQLFETLGNQPDTPHACYTINLSGTTLCDQELAGYIRQRLEESQVNPGDICFEITETEAIRNIGEASRLLLQLRSMGFHCALDDFGSGMSSFNYLKSLPADILKIDGSLIRDLELGNSRFSHAVVSSIRHIAAEVGMLTVAEHVHSESVLEKVRGLGIDFAQGYHLHAPEALPLQQ